MATRSLLAAVSGIQADQTYLDEIGSNIANADTVGYKSGTVQFGDLLSEQISGATAPTTTSGGVNPVAIGSGVRVLAVQTNLSEGTLETTGQPTDVAITGSGYLVVDSGGQQLYTRNGALTLDAAGNLTTLSGGLVQGWQASAGQIKNTGPIGAITVPKGAIEPASATTSLTLGGNLPVWDGTGTPPVVTTKVDAYDALGQTVPVTVKFTAQSTGQWSISATALVPGKTPVHLFGTGATAPVVTFNPATGAITTISGATKTKTGAFSLPVTTMPTSAYSFPATDTWTFTFPAAGSAGALTQFQGSQTLSLTGNGYPAGTLESYAIGSSGLITGSFSNGKTMAIAQIALAGFTNPGGLSDIGNGMLAATPNSGQAQVGVPGTGTRGKLLGGELEQSNVNMGSELTNLITAQEAYQANTKVIATSQQVIQALEQA